LKYRDRWRLVGEARVKLEDCHQSASIYRFYRSLRWS